MFRVFRDSKRRRRRKRKAARKAKAKNKRTLSTFHFDLLETFLHFERRINFATSANLRSCCSSTRSSSSDANSLVSLEFPLFVSIEASPTESTTSTKSGRFSSSANVVAVQQRRTTRRNSARSGSTNSSWSTKDSEASNLESISPICRREERTFDIDRNNSPRFPTNLSAGFSSLCACGRCSAPSVSLRWSCSFAPSRRRDREDSDRNALDQPLLSIPLNSKKSI